MQKRPQVRSLTLADKIARLRTRFRMLADEFLPLSGKGSMWRHSRGWLPTDPHQGWKIHLSTTILSACDLLETVGPYLRECGSAFKATATLEELARLNSGLWYGYSQVGKFLTIYPSNIEDFRKIVADLDLLLSNSIEGPGVPFDYCYKPASNIYFRYGAFVVKKEHSKAGDQQAAIVAPDGSLVPDRRDSESPEWATPPLDFPQTEESVTSSFSKRYQIFRSISQRGKGGVYEGIDLSGLRPQLCIIKEGRKNGETAWDGRDGFDRIKNEEKVLTDLSQKGLESPSVIDSFTSSGNYYLVIERITGNTLQKLLARRKRRLSLSSAIRIGRKIASVMADIHAAGWVWRDCKPANLFVTTSGAIRPIDFEGTCPIGQPDPLPWNTPGFTPPELFLPWLPDTIQSNIAEDLFALGTCLYFLFEGKLPQPIKKCSTDNFDYGGKKLTCSMPNDPNIPTKIVRRRFPVALDSLVTRLMSETPDDRPSATTTLEVLTGVEGHLAQKIRKADIVADRIE